MTKLISKRFFLTAGFSATLGHMALAKAPAQSLRPVARGSFGGSSAAKPRQHVSSPDALIAGAKLSGATGFAVADLRSGKLLETGNAGKAMPPASTAKAITALYALESLGSGFTFKTRVAMTGSMSGGVVNGDLILLGGGDPTLDTDALAAMAAQLKQAGVREVRGGFFYFEGALPNLTEIDKSQPAHVGYNPSVSGLNLNFNRVHFEWRRNGADYSISMDARSEKYRPAVSISKMRIAPRSLPVYTYKDGGRTDSWTVARGALGKGGSRWLPVRKPGLYTADVFQTFARSKGIALARPKAITTLPKSRTLVTHSSAPLQKILRDMMKYSTNLTAEVVGMTATQARSGKATTLRASAKTMSAWANSTLKMGQASFVDHSGLGEDSRVTAQGMVNALMIARKRGDYASLMKKIHMRDAKRKIIKNHPLQVYAKTGTLNFVSALAGYMTTPDGRSLAFAISSSDLQRRARIAQNDKEAPKGGRQWNRSAKALQQRLIERWGAVYG